MSRPRPLTSDLEDVSPIAPKAPAPTEKQAKEKAPTTERTKLGFYSDQGGRIRAAYMNTRGREPQQTFGEFMESAILDHVARLEKKYNNGAEWDDVDAGAVKGIAQMGVGRNRR